MTENPLMVAVDIHESDEWRSKLTHAVCVLDMTAAFVEKMLAHGNFTDSEVRDLRYILDRITGESMRSMEVRDSIRSTFNAALLGYCKIGEDGRLVPPERGYVVQESPNPDYPGIRLTDSH